MAAGLKGTILLAEEGINLFLAGDADAVRGFVDDLREDPRFAALTTKESWSDEQPFRKMLVKVKREIIRMDHPDHPAGRGRAPAVAPETLRRWLDQGRRRRGPRGRAARHAQRLRGRLRHVHGALDWRIERFTQFPDAAAAAARTSTARRS